MEPTEGAIELTKQSQVRPIAPKVGSTEFTDISLGNVLFHTAVGVNSGKGG